jgi:serine/threonine protein kinase
MRNALDRDVIDEPPLQFLRAVGAVFAEFGHLTQDSGNVSYGVRIDADRYFVKTAGQPDDSRPFLTYLARVELLRNAAQIARTCRHSVLPRLYRVIESPCGPLLVYEWLDGELIGVHSTRRDDPDSSFQRFRRLPTATIEGCLDMVFDLHNKLAGLGWIAVDFYDGSLIYDFKSGNLGVVDLDTYRQGPFRNEMGRMFGSTRFMAPEEFELDALIDQRTNVFVMGRTALVLLSDGTLNRSAFRGAQAVYEVVAKACEPEPSRRYDSLDAFDTAWRAARAVSISRRR